jgi:hypothetical protein
MTHPHAPRREWVPVVVASAAAAVLAVRVTRVARAFVISPGRYGTPSPLPACVCMNDRVYGAHADRRTPDGTVTGV